MRPSLIAVALLVPTSLALSISTTNPSAKTKTTTDTACTPRFWEWRSPRNLLACLEDLRTTLTFSWGSPQLVLDEIFVSASGSAPAPVPSDVSTSLVISNVDIAPDGHIRTCVHFCCDSWEAKFNYSAVVANQSFPGPLIKAHKVLIYSVHARITT